LPANGHSPALATTAPVVDSTTNVAVRRTTGSCQGPPKSGNVQSAIGKRYSGEFQSLTKAIDFNINGTRRTVTADANTPLIYILRNDLKLKGTRFGCGQGVCGCCTVLLDGRSVQSCNTPVSAAEAKTVTTIEGLGSGAALHPLQQAFIEEQAGQCGYCLTGIIMGAASLLNRNPSPTDAHIRSELDIHLCRCGSYDRILRAIRRASQKMSKGRGL
jgi:nicotinate dehydrogenase subunit A